MAIVILIIGVAVGVAAMTIGIIDLIKCYKNKNKDR